MQAANASSVDDRWQDVGQMDVCDGRSMGMDDARRTMQEIC